MSRMLTNFGCFYHSQTKLITLITSLRMKLFSQYGCHGRSPHGEREENDERHIFRILIILLRKNKKEQYSREILLRQSIKKFIDINKVR